MRPPESNKFLPPVDEELEKVKKFDWDISGKLRDFMSDCARLGFEDRESQTWYANLIKRIDEVMPDLNKVLDREIKYSLKDCKEGHENINVLDEYRGIYCLGFTQCIRKTS